MIAIPTAAILLGHAAGHRYEDESFSESSPHARRYPTDAAATIAPPARCCWSQGYGL